MSSNCLKICSRYIKSAYKNLIFKSQVLTSKVLGQVPNQRVTWARQVRGCTKAVCFDKVIIATFKHTTGRGGGGSNFAKTTN